MFELFKAELLRFRGWAIAAAALHLAGVLMMCRLIDPAQQSLSFYRLFAAVYGLAGLLLGLWQMGSYRRGSAWLNLLHRPLAPWRIAAALSGAGLLWLALAIGLPLLAGAGYQAAFTQRVIDLRHGLLPVAALLIAACGYLAGAYATLANRRIAVTAFVFLFALAECRASGWLALLVQAILLLWLAALLLTAFQPNLAALPRSIPATLLTAPPLQMAILLGFALLAIVAEMGWIMQGSHPLNMGVPPAGGYIALRRMPANQRMAAGLAGRHDADAVMLRRQIGLSKVHTLGQQIGGTVQRERLTNDVPLTFNDTQYHRHLVFSHDRMRLVSYRLRDGHRTGELGVGDDNAAFPVPVQPAGTLPGLQPGDQMLLGANVAYQYDSRAQQIRPRITLAADETVYDIEPVGAQLAAVSDRAVYLYDNRPLAEGHAALTPRQRVPLPCRFGDLAGIDLIEMVDGYLFSFDCSGRAALPHGAAPRQVLLRVHDDGRTQIVAHHRLHQDYPPLFRYRYWLPSPLLYRLGHAGEALFALPAAAHATTSTPTSMKVVAACLALLSLLGAVWLGARRGVPLWPRLAWLTACLLLGLPALISLWLLYPRSDRIDTGARRSTPAH